MDQPVNNDVRPTNRTKAPNTKKLNMWSKRNLVGIVLLVVVLVAAYFGASAFQNRGLAATINTKQYQAVFLTNGQVYFGKLSPAAAGYVQVEDIYYLQVQTAQPAGTATKDSTTPKTDSTQLVKLGQELHAPEDKMVISKEQILFFENIKDNSKVVQAIKAYQTKK